MTNICISTGKLCFSRRTAGEVINQYKKHHHTSGKYPRRYYFCNNCGTYHITSQKYNIT
ncbi:MAG: hypothetical protein SO369_05665 [Treponema sp.]|nr:hypothetical protein [Treponema sp.]